jgi:hypothetical protein
LAPASTNLLVQPVIVVVGAGLLIWLLGPSALVGLGVSIISRASSNVCMLTRQLMIGTAGPIGKSDLPDCHKRWLTFSQVVSSITEKSTSPDQDHRRAGQADVGNNQQHPRSQAICLRLSYGPESYCRPREGNQGIAGLRYSQVNP